MLFGYQALKPYQILISGGNVTYLAGIDGYMVFFFLDEMINQYQRFFKYITTLDDYYKNVHYINDTKIECLKNKIRLKFLNEIIKLVLGIQNNEIVDYIFTS